MKKVFHLALIVLFVVCFGACANTAPEPGKGIIKPGDKIGDMTVEQGSTVPYPYIWQFCDMGPEEFEPYLHTTDCEVPLVSSLDIYFGWFAKGSNFSSNWDAMTLELYIDDYQIEMAYPEAGRATVRLIDQVQHGRVGADVDPALGGLLGDQVHRAGLRQVGLEGTHRLIHQR